MVYYISLLSLLLLSLLLLLLCVVIISSLSSWLLFLSLYVPSPCPDHATLPEFGACVAEIWLHSHWQRPCSHKQSKKQGRGLVVLGPLVLWHPTPVYLMPAMILVILSNTVASSLRYIMVFFKMFFSSTVERWVTLQMSDLLRVAAKPKQPNDP